MEQWTGLEPASTSFEDWQLIHLAHHCMVRAEGIEPSTFRLWADYSNHWVIPASSHNESGSGKHLSLRSTIFWILRRGELKDATDNPQYVLSIPFTTTLTMSTMRDYCKYFTHHIGTSLTGLCKKFSLQKFCFFVFSLASINNQITTSNVKAKIIST